MQSLKNYLLLFLSATTLAFAGLSWWQARELARRETPLAEDSAPTALRERIVAAEQRVHALEAELASVQPIAPGNPAVETPEPGPKASRNRPGQDFSRFHDDPEVRRLMAVRQTGSLDGRYAKLFKALNLSPQQLENFKRLLIEKQASASDVFAAARAEGLDARANPAALQQLVTGAQAEVDASIQAAIGSTAFAAYKQYEATLPYRGIVSQLEQRTSYGNAPLSETQSQQMLQVFAETNAAASADPAQRRFNFNGAAPGNNAITADTLARAQGILNSTQLAALQQLQQEQQAQTELNRLMRNQRRNSATPTAPATK